MLSTPTIDIQCDISKVEWKELKEQSDFFFLFPVQDVLIPKRCNKLKNILEH